MNRDDVISHLQIMHTWATFALEKDKNFFNDAHMESIAEWTTDAIVLLKEQETETEWCERCGRVRLKSKWEGRRSE